MKRMLVVMDSPSLGNLFAHSLEKENDDLEIEVYRTLGEGQQAYEQKSFDFVLCDDEVDGPVLQWARQLRESGKKVAFWTYQEPTREMRDSGVKLVDMMYEGIDEVAKFFGLK